MALFTAAFLGGMTASYLGVLAERGFRQSLVGRSRCVCGTPVSPQWNIPVLGWLVLRGRARCCAAAIPLRYVVSEAVLASAAAVSYQKTGVLGAVFVVVVLSIPVTYLLRRRSRVTTATDPET